MNLWGVEFLLRPTPSLLHTDCPLRFHEFSQCSLGFPSSLNSWSVCLSVSFSLSPQRCACLLSASLASFPSSACESLCAGCRYITSIFLELFPSLPVSDGSLPHYFILCHQLEADGDHELSMLFVHPHHEKWFPMAFTLCSGQAGENLVPRVRGSPRCQRLSCYEISSFRQRGESI